MWKHTRQGRHYLTDQAKAYYNEVRYLVMSQGRLINIDHPIQVSCLLFPPDKRRRDMDNAWKVLADSLTKANVWQDDHLIRKLTLEWQQPMANGRVMVSVAPHDENLVTS